ncbi:hypothetical protein C1645_775515, partial [Glomus cerebriforme]
MRPVHLPDSSVMIRMIVQSSIIVILLCHFPYNHYLTIYRLLFINMMNAINRVNITILIHLY